MSRSSHFPVISNSPFPECDSGRLSNMKGRFLPKGRDFPVVQPSGIHVFLHPTIEERISAIKAVTPANRSFSDRVNREIERVSSYYEAVELWVNFEHRAVLLAERLGLTKDQYRDRLSACKMNSVVAFGFGDGASSQIFQGKTRIGDVAFSAIAPPRLYRQANVTDSGYVFRFCVGKCELSGFEEDPPLYMLDTKVVETLTAWHEASFPGQPIEENPLLSSMAKLLLVPTHDWGHSWLLYDRDAHTSEFKEWGDDIYNVPHRLDNKLLINYEIITASMHKYTWDMLFDSDPGLQTSILSELQSYHAAVLSFASFVEKWFGKERAEQEENYLMYVLLSTLPCVLNWRMPELGSILERYPVVHEQVGRILGSFFDVLSSNQDGVTSKSREGQEISTAEYIRAYPLKEEIVARRRREREQALFKHGEGVSVEAFRAFKALPDCVSNQFEDFIPDPSVLPTLTFGLDRLTEELRGASASDELIERVYERIRVSSSGHLFFRLERNEIDYDQLAVCEQDKRVLLVEVPAGSVVPLRPRISTNLVQEVTKQVTSASDQDMIAFNVQSESHAQEILNAGAGIEGIESLHAMIGMGNELSKVRSVAGAQDIYPLRRTVAERLYGSANTGYRELLARKRLACATSGPLELPLHDGSVQRTLSGVLVYVPPEDPQRSGNEDPDPDMHGIEEGVFDRTYSAAASSMAPFLLRARTPLTEHCDPVRVSQALHRFVRTLGEINLQLDLGSSAGEIGRGLFSGQ